MKLLLFVVFFIGAPSSCLDELTAYLGPVAPIVRPFGKTAGILFSSVTPLVDVVKKIPSWGKKEVALQEVETPNANIGIESKETIVGEAIAINEEVVGEEIVVEALPVDVDPLVVVGAPELIDVAAQEEIEPVLGEGIVPQIAAVPQEVVPVLVEEDLVEEVPLEAEELAVVLQPEEEAIEEDQTEEAEHALEEIIVPQMAAVLQEVEEEDSPEAALVELVEPPAVIVVNQQIVDERNKRDCIKAIDELVTAVEATDLVNSIKGIFKTQMQKALTKVRRIKFLKNKQDSSIFTKIDEIDEILKKLVYGKNNEDKKVDILAAITEIRTEVGNN